MTAPRPKPTFLSVTQVADRLNISTMSAYRLVHAGEIRAYRFGRSLRIELADLHRYMRNAEVR